MDVVRTVTDFGRATWRGAAWAAGKANVGMRHSNAYRVLEHALRAQMGDASSSLIYNQFAIDCLADFDTYDQDKPRPDWARKLQLTYMSRRAGQGLAAFVSHLAEHETQNPVLLRQLRQISDAVVGPRAGARDARAYIKRAAVKLHPDKCRDLEGWELPSCPKSRLMPADYKYEQAKWGAEGLFALHRSLDRLYASSHYQVALYQPAAKNGRGLKPQQAAADFTVVSAAYTLLAAKITVAAACVIGGGYAVLAAWWAAKAYRANKAKKQQVTCRELVLLPQPIAGRIGQSV